MQVWLQVSAGQSIGQKFHLRGGQLARFGRSDWADFSFPDDDSMDDIHFEVQVDQGGASLSHKGTETETLVNGDPVKEARIQDGDQVTAGETTFTVVVEGEILEKPAEPTPSEETIDPMHVAIDTVALARYLDLDEAAVQYASQQQTPAELLAQLKQHSEFPSAVHVQAHFLPKPKAVAWGVACFHDVSGDKLPPTEAQTLAAAEKWATQAADADRIHAGALAEAASYDGPAATLCLAAFCSEGNIGHPDHDPVIADERITASCVAAALVQAAYWGDPSQSTERFQRFLEHKLLASE